jgi:preprotein translocase subunit SecD
MMTKQLNRLLWGAAMISLVSIACSNRLKDYTQLTVKASAKESAELSQEWLDETKSILENRLVGLGIELAEVETLAPDQIVIRLPQTVDEKAAEAVLLRTGRLYLRNQKPGTEAKLASAIEDLQGLLVDQNILLQSDKPAAAETIQAEIDKTRQAISALFEPSEPVGARLQDARAVSVGNEIWDVNIQFDEQGAQQFAEQTKVMAGTGRSIGLFLDDVLLSTPVVDVAYAKTGITGGTAVISGSFTQTAARDLEIQLKSGALPVTLETVEIVSSDAAKSAERPAETSPAPNPAPSPAPSPAN